MAAAGIRFGLSLALIWGSRSALQQSPSALAIGQRGEQTAVRHEGQRNLDHEVSILYPAGRRACASERLDDNHTAAAAWAGIRVGRIGFARVIGSLVWNGGRGRREQLTHLGDVMRAAPLANRP